MWAKRPVFWNFKSCHSNGEFYSEHLFVLSFTLTLQGPFSSIFSRKHAPLARAVTDGECRGGGHNLMYRLLHLSSAFCSVLHSSARQRSWGQTGRFLLPMSLFADTSSDLLLHYCFLHTHSFFLCYGLGNIPPGFLIRLTAYFSRSCYLGGNATQEEKGIHCQF